MTAILRYIPYILAILSFRSNSSSSDSAKEKRGGISLGAVFGILAGYHLLKSSFDSTVSEREKSDIESTEVLIAQRIYLACNQTIAGVDVGTDELALYQIATEIGTKELFDNITKSYQRQYSESMITRLQNELGNKYTFFVSKLAFNSKSNPTTQPQLTFSKGDVLSASRAVNGYLTTDSTRVFATFEAGEKVGTYQGSTTDLRVKGADGKLKNVYALMYVERFFVKPYYVYVEKSKLYKQ